VAKTEEYRQTIFSQTISDPGCWFTGGTPAVSPCSFTYWKTSEARFALIVDCCFFLQALSSGKFKHHR
jgi:hypothetical protein